VRSKGCLSNKTALAMIFKLAEAAEKHWRRLDGILSRKLQRKDIERNRMRQSVPDRSKHMRHKRKIP
jgi:hypothetical protein